MPLHEQTLQRLRNNDPILTTLNLANNQIGADGTKVLAGGLEKNTTLISLDLTYNQIGADGAKALAGGLEKNTTITSLNLGGNHIDAEGAEALAGGLEKNTTLTSLNLGSNQIGAEGAKALAGGLERNATLTLLNVGNNEISAIVQTEIQSLVKRNQQFLAQIQAAACQQLKVGRLLLYKSKSTISGVNYYLELPLELKEKIIHYTARNTLITEEQQRLVLNYAEGKIAPVADKLSFFKVTKCDRVRKHLTYDEVEAAEQKLAQLTVFS